MENDPIAYIGHGAMFSQDGKEIIPTPEFIRDTQNQYIDTLTRVINENQRSEFQSLRALLQSQSKTPTESLLANSVLIDWLIDVANVSYGNALKGKNNLIKQYLTSEIPLINQPLAFNPGDSFKIGESLQATLRNKGLSAYIDSAASISGGTAYAETCSKSNVPIPPNWGDSKWIDKGELKTLFISKTLKYVKVYAYDSTNPEGVCLALPRGNTINSDITLLGIICLGRNSSKACFWDNQINGKSTPIKRGQPAELLEHFSGGPDLDGEAGGFCSDCHSGENPFIIHPNSALGAKNLKGLKLKSAKWYEPIVAATWPQNPGPTTIPNPDIDGESCTGCHKLPDMSRLSFYCSDVFDNAVVQTMPPGSPGDPAYKAHVNALRSSCK
jgi:hypothetical protein